jgi:hypothetical protein
MDQYELRAHIAALSGSRRVERRGLVKIAAACWPGGMSDRVDPAALQWVRRWRPEKIGPSVPVCSCQVGHCALCN